MVNEKYTNFFFWLNSGGFLATDFVIMVKREETADGTVKCKGD